MRGVLLLIVLSGCGYFKKSPEITAKADDRTEALLREMTSWQLELQGVSDQESGWPSASDCDGTLWAGLAKAAHVAVKLELAEKSSGEIIRSPLSPCTPASRDMVLGYAYGVWEAKDLGALERLADYGEAHAWYMSSDKELSSIDPGGQGVIGRAIYGLSSGKDKRSYKDFPLICIAFTKDYEQHLQTLAALLAGEVADTLESHRLKDIPEGCTDVLKKFASDSPNDALFQTALGIYTGDMTKALDLLLSPSYACPSYVRGDPNYCLVHKVFTAQTLLGHVK